VGGPRARLNPKTETEFSNSIWSAAILAAAILILHAFGLWLERWMGFQAAAARMAARRFFSAQPEFPRSTLPIDHRAVVRVVLRAIRPGLADLGFEFLFIDGDAEAGIGEQSTIAVGDRRQGLGEE
jgi:hypothetical protein